MSTIRCIYREAPNFPATDQHPNAVRYQVGALFVDAIGGQPTQAEVDALLTPPPTQDEIDTTAAKAYAKLNALKNMTPAQVDAWVTANVTNLAQAQDAIKTLAIGVSILARRL